MSLHFLKLHLKPNIHDGKWFWDFNKAGSLESRHKYGMSHVE